MSKRDSERGATLIMVALMLVLLLSFVALSVDVGVGYAERRRTQNAADAAALAGVQVLAELGTDAQVRAAVNEYAINQNLADSWSGCWLRGFPPACVADLNASRPSDVTGVQVTASGSTPTFFAGVLGIASVTANASSLGAGGFSPLDIVLVIDKSGSMESDSCLLKGVKPPNPNSVNLRPNWSNGKCGNNDVNLNESTCPDCRGTWNSSTSRCRWPNNTVMNPFPTVCGTLNSANCQACRGAWTTPVQPMADTQSAANRFIDMNNPILTKLGLVTFSDSSRIDVHLTNNYATVKAGVNAINPGGTTNASAGLNSALTELQSTNARVDASKFIVFLTDGVPNNGCSACTTPGCCPAAVNAAYNAANTAASRAVTIFTIGLGSMVDGVMLQGIADRTGGDYFHAPTSADLQAIYETVFEKIKVRLVQ